jgi:hypothetical protein
MNPKLHTALRILFALFLIVSGAKHLYTVYWGDPTIMATGYPEKGAEAFVLAVLATKFLLPMICTTKLIAGVLMVLPKRESLGVLVAFPYSVGMLAWGVFMVPSHLLIMGGIFAINAALVYANWNAYKSVVGG